MFAALSDPESRKDVLTKASFDKLKKLDDAAAWTRWLKSEVERERAEKLALAEKELHRSRESLGTGGKDKWRVQLRITTEAYSIRPKALRSWNAGVDWIKLAPVQGGKGKGDLLVESTIGDDVPVQGLWNLSLGMATTFIVALNLGPSGFWWWGLPRHKTPHYEKIVDLESGNEVKIERSDYKIFHDRRPALAEEHMNWVVRDLAALPGPANQQRHFPYNHYLGGLYACEYPASIMSPFKHCKKLPKACRASL